MYFNYLTAPDSWMFSDHDPYQFPIDWPRFASDDFYACHKIIDLLVFLSTRNTESYE